MFVEFKGEPLPQTNKEKWCVESEGEPYPKQKLKKGSNPLGNRAYEPTEVLACDGSIGRRGALSSAMVPEILEMAEPITAMTKTSFGFRRGRFLMGP